MSRIYSMLNQGLANDRHVDLDTLLGAQAHNSRISIDGHVHVQQLLCMLPL